VDAGYRGEIKVILLNTDSQHPVRFRRGDRIAQLVIQRVERPVFIEVTSLPGSQRGEGGHGSTGGHAMAADLPGADDIPAATGDAGR
jgi:dUTP pyrophosphatase